MGTTIPTRTGEWVLTPFTLSGSLVRLEPLDATHIPGLAAAAAEDRSTYAYTWVPDGTAETAAYVASATAAAAGGRQLPFAVRRVRDDRVVGTTRLLDLEVLPEASAWPPGSAGLAPDDARAPSVAEIGSTWYAYGAQRTGVNAETKLLLLGWCFDTWACLRVTLKTDARNARSRAAIERLGARSEGVRRAHVRATDGTVRDSAYYSILASEWPAVRSGLLARLQQADWSPNEEGS